MSNEIPPQRPVKTRRKEDPPFRRKEDQLRFDMIEKTLTTTKWLIGLIVIILYFFYQTVTSQNQTDAYQIKLQNEILDKLNHLKVDAPYVGQSSIIPVSCIGCHVPGRMDIKLQKDWNFENFRNYVRGTVRIPENNIMPKHDREMISDKELEQIYLNLKKGQ